MEAIDGIIPKIHDLAQKGNWREFTFAADNLTTSIVNLYENGTLNRKQAMYYLDTTFAPAKNNTAAWMEWWRGVKTQDHLGAEKNYIMAALIQAGPLGLTGINGITSIEPVLELLAEKYGLQERLRRFTNPGDEPAAPPELLVLPDPYAVNPERRPLNPPEPSGSEPITLDQMTPEPTVIPNRDQIKESQELYRATAQHILDDAIAARPPELPPTSTIPGLKGLDPAEVARIIGAPVVPPEVVSEPPAKPPEITPAQPGSTQEVMERIRAEQLREQNQKAEEDERMRDQQSRRGLRMPSIHNLFRGKPSVTKPQLTAQEKARLAKIEARVQELKAHGFAEDNAIEQATNEAKTE